MALVMCLACGLLAGASVWALVCDDGLNATSAHLQLVERMVARAMRAMASSHVVELLIKRETFRAVASELLVHAPKDMWGTLEEAGAALLVGFGVTTLAGGLLFRSVLGALVIAVVLVVAMRSFVLASRAKETRLLAEEMPSVFRTLATALESGNTLVQAIDYVGLHERGLVAKAFARASLGLRCSMSVDETLARLRAELNAPGIDLMATALSISQRTGSPLRDLFRRSALLVERQEELERTLAVRTAQVRLSVRVVCGLPAIMIGLLLLISPDFRQGIATVPGVACLALAAVMDGIALLWIRHILEGVL